VRPSISEHGTAEAAHSRRTFLRVAGGACAALALPSSVESAFLPSQPVDLLTLSLSEASELVRARKVSPIELTAACLTRIERLNPVLNAFITVTAEQAAADALRAEAEIMKGQWRGPLHGIPVGLKDLFDTAGVKTTGGSAQFVDRVPAEDAEVVRRLKAAGAVIVGKHNLHEFGLGATSASSHFGPVHNPWNPDYVAGGSSGGSAAAVAASLCYAALGTDTGGSVRIPASFCGIVGLKPTYGRVSSRGVIPLSSSLDHVGPLTRNVLDAALVLQAIAGHDDREITSVDRAVPAFAAAIRRGASSLRLGVPREYFFATLDADIQMAMDDALEVLSKTTAGVRDINVPVRPDVNAAVMSAEAFSFHASRIQKTPQLFQPAVLGRLRAGEAVATTTYIERRRELDQLRLAAQGLFANVDLLVTPAVPVLPVRIAAAQDDDAGTAVFARNTRPFNAYGLPVASIPCGFARNGLPIGLQIVGPPWAEESVLRLAHAFEQATEWRKRRPAL
jgi:aspartyl-tRNA(Asn)/glutamyl-tRNA(Gln) amidotransferase subunit A